MKNLTICVFMGMMVALGCSQLPNFDNTISKDIEIINSGQYSNYPEEGKISKTISKKAVFKEEWNKVHAGQSPTPDVPDVNFNNRNLALIILDTKPSGGFDIGEIEVYESENETVIAYSEIAPGEGCMVTMAMTRPYVFLSYPDNGNDVKFLKKEDIINKCDE